MNRPEAPSNRLIVGFYVVLAVLLLGCSHYLGPDDIQAAQDTAASAADAAHAARQQARYERAARKACGGNNSTWRATPDGAIQCYGDTTITAQVAL